MRKYELTDETITIDGHTLHRIRALRDFGDTEVGDLGGFVESESNLSHDGYCWVADNAMVFGNAVVFDGAWVYDNAQVFGNAQVCCSAKVFGNAKIFGYAEVYGYAKVYGCARTGGLPF